MTGHQWAGSGYVDDAPATQDDGADPGVDTTWGSPASADKAAAAARPVQPPPPAAGHPEHEAGEPAVRSSRDLMPGHPQIEQRPAIRGWRAVVRKATFGAVAPKASQAELEELSDRRAVNAQWSHGKTVVVANPKGGAGKSPTVIGVAATFGDVRGGAATVAWDNNETLGTLGIRTEPGRLPTTAVDLLAHLEDFERIDAQRGDLGRYLRHQQSGQFDVLVSDDDPKRMSEIGAEEYRRIHEVLRRWNDVIVVDTGNNPRAANFRAAVQSADVLVIPVRWAADVVVSAGRLIDQLRANGHDDLVARAVTVVTGTSASHAGLAEQTAQWRAWFTEQTSAVIEVPYDPHLAVGQAIVYGDLQPTTRRAYLRVAAAISGRFTDLDTTTEYRRIKETTA